MANVLLTTRCVRSCPYCFAKRGIEGEAPDERMGWENLVHVANFLHVSGERHVSLLGGEPTLHPDFVDFVLYFIERNFHVTVFTSGVMSEARLGEVEAHLGRLNRDRLQFVCNLNDPVLTPCPEGETKRLEAFLAAMGPWTTPGFNIYREDFTLDFLFDLILRYGLSRRIRLGVSHPIPGAASMHLGPEALGRVLDRLCSFRERFDRARVRPGFDCGFPMCRLSDEQLGWLTRVAGQVNFGCSPCVDITPDLSVYSCFPLSRYQRRSLLDFDTMGEVRAFFQRVHDHLRIEVPGIFDACEQCAAREERVCAGGGVCQIVRRLVEEAPVRLQEIEHELPALVLPFEPALLARLAGRDLVVRTGDPALVPAVRPAVERSGNRLRRVVLETDGPLSALEPQEDWRGTPVWLRPSAMGPFRDVVARLERLRAQDLLVHLPVSSPEALVGLRVLSSVGVRGCAAFDGGPVDWDALADLATFALLERAPHAPMEPFESMARSPAGEARANWARFDLEHPGHVVHVDAEGRVALTRAAQARGEFLSVDLAELDRLLELPAYRDSVFAWQQLFLGDHPCARCAGYPACGGRFAAAAGDAPAEPPGCVAFFTEFLAVAERYRALAAKREEAAPWQR